MTNYRESFHQTLAVLTIILNDMHFGIGAGWLAPTLIKLQQPGKEMQVTIDDISWIGSSEYVGKIFGCLLSAYLLDKIGRKIPIAGCTLIYFFVWLGITFANSVWIICWMRFIFGMASGVNMAVNSFYLAEVTSPSLRPVFGAIIKAVHSLGLLGEYIIATYFSYKVTAIMNTIIGFIILISIFWLVEPVQYLLMKGNVRMAKKNFMWLNGATEFSEVEEEFGKIKENAEFENEKKVSYKKLLASPENRKSLMIVFLVFLLSDATGYLCIVSYSSHLFSSTETFTENEFTVLLGVLQCVSNIFALLFVARCNRRTLLLTCYFVCTIAHASTALVYFVNEKVMPIPGFPWIIFLTVSAYIGVEVFSYSAVFTIRGELLPLSIKAAGGCFVIVCDSAMNFALVKAFLYTSRSFGMYINFAFFSASSLVQVIFMYFYLPETKNKTLTQIQDEFISEREKDQKMQKLRRSL